MKINQYFNNADKYKQFTILIPCYNEEQTIGTVLANMISLNPARIVVVDDGSKDKSAKIIKRIQKISPVPIIYISNRINLGQGASIQNGIKYLNSNIDCRYVVTVDADNQHRRTDVLALMERALESDADFVLSQRIFKNVAFRAKVNNTLTITASVVFFGVFLKDPFCGLRCYSKSLFNQINFFNREEWNFSSNELYFKSKHRTCVFIPATYTDYSRSKGISYYRGVKMIARLTAWKINRILKINEIAVNNIIRNIRING
ncbi:MAG: glycosyltransferase family 2 protein [Bacteroidota bacterium]|nr:glycosyltransferase family 2 protein [Bacteroidota bacterium]